MSASCAGADRVSTLAKLQPQAISIDEDAALVEHAFEEKGGTSLNPVQVGHIHPATRHLLKAGLQAQPGRIVGERHEHVQVGAGVLVAPRLRTVENGQPHPTLGTKRPSKTGEKPPMSTKVFLLPRREA